MKNRTRKALESLLEKDADMLPLFSRVLEDVDRPTLARFLAHAAWSAFEAQSTDRLDLEDRVQDYLDAGPSVALALERALLEQGRNPEYLLKGVDTGRAIIGAHLVGDTASLEGLYSISGLGTFIELHSIFIERVASFGGIGSHAAVNIAHAAAVTL